MFNKKKQVLLIATLALNGAVLAHEGVHSKNPAVQLDTMKQGAIIGQGEFIFKVNHNWLDQQGEDHLGATHGDIVFDEEGYLYVSFSDGQFKGIAKFSADGKFVKKLKGQYPDVHGMLIRKEGGREYIYAVSNTQGKMWKIDLQGNTVFSINKTKIVEDSKVYKANDKGEYRVALTSVTVGPDGDIFLADGYSSNFIHIYTHDGKYKKSFGGWGKDIGRFHQAHDITIDTRFEQPYLVICNRANNRIEHWDFQGNFVRVISEGLRMPGKIAFWEDNMIVAELKGRVSILDKDHEIVAHLGENSVGLSGNYHAEPEQWKQGEFLAPHTAKFDKLGNLYVMDWNYLGRVTQLVKQ
ncbi:6-bladed beta-propeller [Agaribacter flavus]|uniref:6-bladed beta-propeller n=1 Tax=Agaribacter flavus TaxID=1902781 RepID=A0ABV7FQ08_9ALTE